MRQSRRFVRGGDGGEGGGFVEGGRKRAVGDFVFMLGESGLRFVVLR